MTDHGFRPGPLLRNRHVQSILASLKYRRRRLQRRGSAMEAAAEAVILDCGDGVRLQCHISRASTAAAPTAVLIHGWEGSHESVYLFSLAHHLFERGYTVVRLNLRDHGGTHDLNREAFHSARMDEVFGALAAIRGRVMPERLFVVGFSLGGNFALRIAAGAPAHGLPLDHVVAVNPAINPRATTAALDRSRLLYRRYFMSKWRRSVMAKHAAHPDLFDPADFLDLESFEQLTGSFARQFTPYESLDDYFDAYHVTPERLTNLRVPTTIITAADDPVVPIADFHGFRQIPNLELIVTRHGGHCGYVTDWRFNSWLDHRIAAALAPYSAARASSQAVSSRSA